MYKKLINKTRVDFTRICILVCIYIYSSKRERRTLIIYRKKKEKKNIT